MKQKYSIFFLVFLIVLILPACDAFAASTSTPSPTFTLIPTDTPTHIATTTLTSTITPTLTPSPALTEIMTPVAEDSVLLIEGLVQVRDENDTVIAQLRLNSIEPKVIGIAGDYYVILYENEVAYVKLSTNAQLATITPTPTITPTLTPSPALTEIMTPVAEDSVLLIEGLVQVRDENDTVIAQLRLNSDKPQVIGIAGDYYVILYENEVAYVKLSTNAQLATITEPFGVNVTTSVANDVPSSEFSIGSITSRIPDEWLAENPRYARYNIAINVTKGGEKECGGYNGYLTLTFKGINARVTVVDTITDETVASTSYRSQLPSSCPRSHSFPTYNGIALSDTEWKSPNVSSFGTWLNENVSVLPSLPPTSTPQPTRTPQPTLTPSPTIPTSTPTLVPTRTPAPLHTPTLTPVTNANKLVFIGTVIIRDEYGNTIANVREGEYALLGLVEDNYVILYENEIAYVRLSSSNASIIEFTATPTLTYTPTPVRTPTLTPIAEGNTLIFAGIVIIRDEYGSTIANVREGEYALLGLVEDNYVILYEGKMSYVRLSSTNAHPSIPLTATPES